MAQVSKQTSKKRELSIDEYQGARKWCFTIAFNKALVNRDKNDGLFVESLLRHEKYSKHDWYDEDTRALIKCSTQAANAKAEALRNYFSHYRHSPGCLTFTAEDELRTIMERAYERAIFECRRRETEVIIEFPSLFEGDRITTAGVVFFVSFFVERRVLDRLYGAVSGLKKNEGQYKLTRKALSMYCLKDSRFTKAWDKRVLLFRDILAQLGRIPAEAYEYYHGEQGDKKRANDNEGTNPKRHKDKFIEFALHYLEAQHSEICFGRRHIVREEAGAGDEHKKHRTKGKVVVDFSKKDEDQSYYISKNNVIVRIDKNAGPRSYRMGLNELKYLVLLSLQGKGDDAIAKLYRYRQHVENILDVVKVTDKDNHVFLPRFVLEQHGIGRKAFKQRIDGRVKHVRGVWEKKKAATNEMTLHEKARDILQYVNENCTRSFNPGEYNRLLVCLVGKDVENFQAGLKRLQLAERIDGRVYSIFAQTSTINEMHQVVCDQILNRLCRIGDQKLYDYVGLGKKDEIDYKQKVAWFKEHISIRRGFLRKKFWYDSKKGFAKLVEEHLESGGGQRDVGLDKKYYHIDAIGRFEGANPALYETLARDRLCLMMAQYFLGSVRKELGNKIVWSNDSIELPVEGSVGNEKSIVFSVSDYGKLYVLDDAEFLGRICEYFMPHEKGKIRYHTVYEKGFRAYNDLQKKCVEAVLAFEEKVVKAKKMSEKEGAHYIDFREILAQTMCKEAEKTAVNKVRRAFFHHHLKFVIDEFGLFSDVMKKYGIEKEWKFPVK
ncbi:MAG: hypothetical protein DRP66_05270 [Planctomycetota bacterium]|uniref:Uncharacterized protein n=1 Tax=Planctomycetota bacterium TaxID=2026780 RepID=A0ACD6BAI3_UNCPL|nr:MAG: hypothetical protein DRP66_05270 [Planctomycetota bacterium]